MGSGQDYMLMFYSYLFAMWVAAASAFASFKPSGLEVDTASEGYDRYGYRDGHHPPSRGRVPDYGWWCFQNCHFSSCREVRSYVNSATHMQRCAEICTREREGC